jgi:hypothetical protein
MISELTFAREFASFWRQATPLMDGFVRRVNRAGYRRDFPPMRAATAPNRRAFVNEVAFDSFCPNIDAEQADQYLFPVGNVITESVLRVRSTAANREGEGDYQAELSLQEFWDAAEQVRRLHLQLRTTEFIGMVVCKPNFSGCGMIDSCKGDVIVKNTLFE